MKAMLMKIGMLVVMAVAIVALDSSASAQGNHGGNGRGNGRTNEITHQRDWRANQTHSNRRFGLSHKKDAHGYRNYGQYRRTQVGNRRWNRTHRHHRRYDLRFTRRIRNH